MNYNSVVIRVYSLEVSVLLIDVPLSEGALRGTVFHMSNIAEEDLIQLKR